MNGDLLSTPSGADGERMKQMSALLADTNEERMKVQRRVLKLLDDMEDHGFVLLIDEHHLICSDDVAGNVKTYFRRFSRWSNGGRQQLFVFASSVHSSIATKNVRSGEHWLVRRLTPCSQEQLVNFVKMSTQFASSQTVTVDAQDFGTLLHALSGGVFRHAMNALEDIRDFAEERDAPLCETDVLRAFQEAERKLIEPLEHDVSRNWDTLEQTRDPSEVARSCAALLNAIITGASTDITRLWCDSGVIIEGEDHKLKFVNPGGEVSSLQMFGEKAQPQVAFIAARVC